jgi:hypothetical protein
MGSEKQDRHISVNLLKTIRAGFLIVGSPG